jgi:sporulation protein YlmC with PRC-barrel domain
VWDQQNQNQHNQYAALERLSTSNFGLANSRLDIRGHAVIDQHGNRVGHVSKLFIDAIERAVRLFEVRDGGILGWGAYRFLLPGEAITDIGKNEVHISQSRDRVVDSPVYDPVLVSYLIGGTFTGSALDWTATSLYPDIFILPDDPEQEIASDR